MFTMTTVMQDVNQAFLTKKKLHQSSTDVVSSSVSSSSSECLLFTCLNTEEESQAKYL